MYHRTMYYLRFYVITSKLEVLFRFRQLDCVFANMDNVPFNMDHVPSHMDHSYMELVLLNTVHVPSNYVLSMILCNNFKTQAGDQQGQYEKNRANTGFFRIGSVYFVLALFAICTSMKQAVFGCINAILS